MADTLQQPRNPRQHNSKPVAETPRRGNQRPAAQVTTRQHRRQCGGTRGLRYPNALGGFQKRPRFRRQLAQHGTSLRPGYRDFRPGCAYPATSGIEDRRHRSLVGAG